MEEKKDTFIEDIKKRLFHLGDLFQPWKHYKNKQGPYDLVVTDKDGNKKVVGHMHDF